MDEEKKERAGLAEQPHDENPRTGATDLWKLVRLVPFVLLFASKVPAVWREACPRAIPCLPTARLLLINYLLLYMPPVRQSREGSPAISGRFPATNGERFSCSKR